MSITQRSLDFKLESTSETLTSRSGLAIFYETALHLGVVDAIRTEMPRLGSNRAYRPEEYVMPLVMMLIGGGRALEHIRELRADQGLRRLCHMNRIPSADAHGRWLRIGANHRGAKRVNRHLATQVIRTNPQTDFTLDTDATLMATDKNCAQLSYEGFKAFSALLSFVPELGGLCLISDYRNGNISPATGIAEHLKEAIRFFKSKGKRLTRFRSDSAAYTAEIMNICFQHKVTFTIAADQDAAVKKLIAELPTSAWHRLYDRQQVYTGRQWARVRHCMGKTAEGFDLIVIRWLNPQRDLFEDTLYCYHAIATNDYAHDGAEVIWSYNDRGNAENWIKELKNGFGMEYAPSRDLAANGVYFELGVLAYNLVIAFETVIMRSGWVSKTAATIRWEIVEIAGKVIQHGRQLILRVMKESFGRLQGLRDAIRTCQLVT